MPLPASRPVFLLLAISVIGLMGYGLYSQYALGLQPCPLCMTQRIFFCLVGALALLAFVHNPARLGRAVYGGLISLSALLGGAAAGRQIWLQHLPPEQVPACGPSLEYMLQTFPFGEVLLTMIRGDGNCAEVVWQFWGLSMPGWALLWFAGFTVAGLWQALRKQ